MLLLVSSTLAWLVLEARVSTTEPHERLPREVATGLVLLAVHATAIAARGTPHVVLGGALLAIGIGLRVIAIRTLGAAFVSVTATPARLVRSGPYRIMHHPSEIGLVAAAAGAAVVMGSIVAAAIVAMVLVPLVIVRCAIEDRYLMRASGT